MTEKEYAKIGKWIISNLEKLMSGEYMGRSVIAPIRPKEGGICNIQIDMPTDVQWSFGNDAYFFTWIPSEKAFVLNDYVYKKRKKKIKK